MNLRFFTLFLLAISIVTLSACIYRIDIIQGRQFDADTIKQLKIGMSKDQVKFLLGEPVITDPHHENDWHYIYFSKSGADDTTEQRDLALRFKNDLLSSFEDSQKDN